MNTRKNRGCKKILVILALTLLFTSCRKSLEDAQKVKVGMSSIQLDSIMGEPWAIHLNAGYQEKFFTYASGDLLKGTQMCVTVSNNKVIYFYSY